MLCIIVHEKPNICPTHGADAVPSRVGAAQQSSCPNKRPVSLRFFRYLFNTLYSGRRGAAAEQTPLEDAPDFHKLECSISCTLWIWVPLLTQIRDACTTQSVLQFARTGPSNEGLFLLALLALS